MKLESIKELWDGFAKKVMAADAPPDQVREMQLAFYSGCWVTLNLFVGISDDSVPEKTGIEHLARCVKECEAFAGEFAKGVEGK